MSTSDNIFSRNPMLRRVLGYLILSAACFAIFIIYDQFSHGVRSAYMTYLFGWGLAFGVLPCGFLSIFTRLHRPGNFTINIWRSGVACVTVSSLLRGIFEIAGTGSVYQQILMYFGFGALAAGFFVYLIERPKAE